MALLIILYFVFMAPFYVFLLFTCICGMLGEFWLPLIDWIFGKMSVSDSSLRAWEKRTRCASCGAAIKIGQHYCTSCGAKIEADPAMKNPEK